MDTIFVHGADQAFIIEERTRGWIDTITGARHSCRRHCSSGTVLWGLWERTNPDRTTDRYISCDLVLSSPMGWGYRAWLERDELPYLSCPLAYLHESNTVSESWRTRVAEYWRTPLRTGLRVRKLLMQKQLRILKEGDRVRFIRTGTATTGSLGTVTAVIGTTGRTIHADELCRTTYVEWDDGRAEPVFTASLEHIDALGLEKTHSKQV